MVAQLPVSLSGGTAQLTLAQLPAGNHTIAASYGGAESFLASSATTSVFVSRAAQTITFDRLPD